MQWRYSQSGKLSSIPLSAPGSVSQWQRENVKIDTIYTIKKIISCAAVQTFLPFIATMRYLSSSCLIKLASAVGIISQKVTNLKSSNARQRKIIRHHPYHDEKSYRSEKKFCINIRTLVGDIFLVAQPFSSWVELEIAGRLRPRLGPFTKLKETLWTDLQ